MSLRLKRTPGLYGVAPEARTILAPRAGWLPVALARLFPRVVEACMAEMNGTA